MTIALDANARQQPVVIIGAPRSGTNMLRDALAALPTFTTWPCDEINYLWRHGNSRTPHDELKVEQASPQVRRYIQRRFIKRASHGGIVVEKTCANSLRVPFVNRVLPEALFVWIVRDGRDAVASTQRRWHAKLELGYAAAKARFIPLTDLPYYAAHHLVRRAQRLRTADGRLGSWGPRLHDMEELLAHRPLAEVCAIQWRRCVEQAGQDLAELDPARIHRVRYEDLLEDPVTNLSYIASFAQAPARQTDLCAAVSHIASDCITTPRSALSTAEYQRLQPILAPALAAHGYE